MLEIVCLLGVMLCAIGWSFLSFITIAIGFENKNIPLSVFGIISACAFIFVAPLWGMIFENVYKFYLQFY